MEDTAKRHLHGIVSQTPSTYYKLHKYKIANFNKLVARSCESNPKVLIYCHNNFFENNYVSGFDSENIIGFCGDR
jgi:hypothetical protein